VAARACHRRLSTPHEDVRSPVRAVRAVLATLCMFALRESDGTVHVERDLHRNGLFAGGRVVRLVEWGGFAATSRVGAWKRDVFSGRRRMVSSGVPEFGGR